MVTEGQRLPKASIDNSHPSDPLTLGDLFDALDTAVLELLETDAGDGVAIGSVAMMDGSDLSADTDVISSAPDLVLHVGVANAEAVRWFEKVAQRAPELRPRAVMSKTAAKSSSQRVAARRADIALVTVHPKARWDQVLTLIQRRLDRSRRQTTAVDPGLLAVDADLFDLAQIVAHNAGGMVSIEDAQSRVLAYSASDESADELRTLSILGREGPQDYLRVLQKWGVFDRLRNGDDVVDIPAHDQLGTRRRLAVSIRQLVDSATTTSPAMLGSIWLQQGETPFTADAADVLRGASAIAARIISRSLDAPSAEGLLIQRLFGARGGSIDVPSLASALNLPATGAAAVIGFAGTAPGSNTTRVGFAGVGSMLRLHASSFRRDSVATIIGDRAYVLLPGYTSAQAVTTWVRQLVLEFEVKRSAVLRAAVAIPVQDLAHVAAARVEVDRVLDATAAAPLEGRVTTLAESRTAVVLSEILDLIGQRPDLHDPRLEALSDYDREHSASLRVSTEVYLAYHGDVRAAATAIRVHPNTLRYRIRRAEEILGIRLQDPADRLLLEIQLVMRRRAEGTYPRGCWSNN
ncbi:PucR family transcriptional regulator [Nocardia sp. NPDC059239]|uniref:PucR family transcriptional regulator n=1 Tax=Nocardia sp. NPDC059239 TaxID=3346785 RepID=UPI0036962459